MVPTFVYHHLQGNQNRSGLQFKVARCLGLGSTSRWCGGLWTRQSAARQTHLCPSQPHYGLHPPMFSGNNSLVSMIVSL